MEEKLRVLIIADHSSLQFGGEAALPLHFFRTLRKRGFEVWMIVHSRTQDELVDTFPLDHERIAFIEDSKSHKLLGQLGKPLPNRIAYFTFGIVSRWLTQRSAKRIARKMIKNKGINVIHQPIPVSPREPSGLHNMGVPVVIGPMNGGLDYPNSFQHLQSHWVTLAMSIGRSIANLMNQLVPGKVQARALLVANERTRKALPRGTPGANGRVIELVENGVDFSTWRAPDTVRCGSGKTTFAYMGRLVDWKAVDLLIEAYSQVKEQSQSKLLIMGDGPDRSALESLCNQLGLSLKDDVEFAGWLDQSEAATRLANSDVLVLPSLMECGGAVVLEAMAMGRPVIATNWGGPADYLDESCGILVEPESRNGLIQSLTAAMNHLAESPEDRKSMGEAGARKVREHYDWDQKAERMIKIYEDVLERAEL